MESISVKLIRIRKKKVYLNPLRNPISGLHQWTALKAKDNSKGDIVTGSYQPFLENGFNPLLNPVSDIHEWRALMTKDTKPLMTDHHQSLPKAHSFKWTALKAEDDGNEDIESGSYQTSLEKGYNPLLKPVSNIHEWRALMAKDTKLLMIDHHQLLPKAHSRQWTPLKAEEDNGKEDIETGSYQPFPEKGFNPLLNPVSDIHEWRALMVKDLKPLTNDHQQPLPKAQSYQWTASKAEDHCKEAIETGSYQPFLEKGFNPLLNPVSDIHEWRALMVKDLKPLTNDHQQPLPKAHSYQWTASKAEHQSKEAIETGSYQPFLEKGFNPLLNPVSDIHEWRALMVKDSKQLMTYHQQPPPKVHTHNSNPSFEEFDEERAVDASLSCWLSSSSSENTECRFPLRF